MNKKLYTILFLLFSLTDIYSQTYIDSLLKQVDTNKKDTIQIELLYSISTYYSNTDLQKSVLYAENGTKIAETIVDSMRMAKGYFFSGTQYTLMGLYERALDNLTKSKIILQEKNSKKYLHRCLNNIGNIYWFTKDYNSAIEIYKEVRIISEFMNDSTSLLSSIANIGLCYGELGNPDSSLIYFNTVIDLSKKLGNYYYLGLTYLNLGKYYSSINEYSKAQMYFKKAFENKNSLPAFLIGDIYQSMAEVKFYNGDFTQAEELLGKAKIYIWQSNSLNSKKEFYKIQYNLDSISGNLNAAIKSLLMKSVYDDSIKSEDYNEKLAGFKTIYELEKKENEINKLKKENEIVKLKSKNQWYFLFFLIFIIISSIAIIILSIRSNKIKQNAIKELNILNADLKNHREELTVINEEITAQKEELFDKNDELESIIQKLKETQTQLLHSEKLASIGILASGAAHEINNPLNFISGGMRLLEEKLDKKSKDKVNQPYNMIKEGVKRIAKIVNGLNTFVQIKDSQLHTLQLNDIIESTLQFVNYKISPDIKVLMNLNDIPEIKCYPDKLHVIFLNILSNSLDAVNESKKQKVITITSSLIKNLDNNYAQICFTNTGKHIANEKLKNIFDPFFTTKAPNKGSGMGLTIAYNLVQEHKGKIYVENIEEGVKFTIEIPVI